MVKPSLNCFKVRLRLNIKTAEWQYVFIFVISDVNIGLDKNTVDHLPLNEYLMFDNRCTIKVSSLDGTRPVL